MTVSRIVTTDEFKKMISYKEYAENKKQQQSMKLSLLKEVEAAYGERYWGLDQKTRKAVDMLCWFASERGFVFAKDQYLSDRYGVSSKTIRNVLKVLREEGVIFTVYRRKSGQNGRSGPIQLFKGHPYYAYWKNLLNLPDFQTDFQTEIDATPCESKDEDVKKGSTKYSPLKKSFKTLRKQEPVMDASFVPTSIPKAFRDAVAVFFGEAKDIYRLWGKALLAYRTSSLMCPIEEILPVIVQSFKETMFAHKHNRIKGSFDGYFFGTLRNQFHALQKEQTQPSLSPAVGEEHIHLPSFAHKKSIRTEVLPEWFVQQKQGIEPEEKQDETDEEFLLLKAELEAALRERKQKNKVTGGLF